MEYTARGHYPYSTGWSRSALTGLYPTVVKVQVWCLGLTTRAGTVVVNCTTGKYHDIALAMHRAISHILP